MKPDFCEYCNSSIESDEKLVTLYRHRNGKHFIFERVPARVCSRCGERYFSATAVREMDRLMQKKTSRSSMRAVPVIELKLAG